MSTKSFADLGVSKPVVDVLAQRGVTAPFAVQQLVMSDVLDGSDVLVKSPTGSGKTLAFGIPMVERLRAERPRPAALLPAPTRGGPGPGGPGAGADARARKPDRRRDPRHRALACAARDGRLRRRRPDE